MRARCIITALIVAMAGLWVWAADEVDPRFSLMGEADAAIARGDWSTAESRLVEALDAKPNDPSNYLLMSNLGMVRFNKGEDSLALATLDRAAEIAPRSVTVLSNRAQVRSALGDFEGAGRDYRLVMSIDSTLVSPRFYLGVMALATGDTIAAREHATAISRLAPDSFEDAFLQARLLTEQGEHRLALPHYTALIKLDEQPEYYAARALCYLHLEELNEASADIAAGLALDPYNGDLYLYRAMLNKMRFRPDDALLDARRAVTLGIDPRLVESLLGFTDIKPLK
ncbi:MAG: tetratricopeptide repeat protein [Muribaculaceae bacterium]|nr:tetratricopeptide repeat protein [Muribaculaceae bacterium]